MNDTMFQFVTYLVIGFILFVIAVVLLLAVRFRRARAQAAGPRALPGLPGLPGLLTLVGFGIAAALTGRGLAWWPPAALFVIAPIVADELPLFRLASSTRASRLNAAVVEESPRTKARRKVLGLFVRRRAFRAKDYESGYEYQEDGDDENGAHLLTPSAHPRH